MMTGFKARFEPFVKDGSKQHTLRDIRKGTRQIVQGDRLDCYGNVRQKTMHLIGRWVCIRVQVAQFRFAVANGTEYPRMSIDGVELSPDERDAFAWRDGFRHAFPTPKEINLKPYSYSTDGCFSMMMQYWIAEGATFPFEKQLLHWKFFDRLPDELPKKKRKAPAKKKPRSLAIDHQRVNP